jgi:hypothetical protein
MGGAEAGTMEDGVVDVVGATCVVEGSRVATTAHVALPKHLFFLPPW